MTSRLRMVALLAAFASAAPAARAVVAAKTPPSSMFTNAAAVVTGQVSKVSADTGTIEATATTLTGDAVGDAVKFKLVDMPAVLAAVKPGAPIVLFLGKRTGGNALHVADGWHFPEPVPGSRANYVVKKDLEANLRQSYPSTSAALVKVVEELKSTGKSTMLNEVALGMFAGGIKDLGKIDATGVTSLICIRQGKHPGQHAVLIASTADSHNRYMITTEGIKPDLLEGGKGGLSGVIASAVDASSNPVSLKSTGDFSIFEKAGDASSGKTTKLWSDPAPASAAAFGNFGEEPDKTYALVVKEDNVYRYALDGQGAPPADFFRLTGERVTTYHKENPKWLAGATAAAIDCNGDGRMDFLINTAAGPLLLINRGFGAFFIDADIAKVLKTPAGEPLRSAKTLWTATDVDHDGLDDLILLNTDTGAVTAVMNPKPIKKD